MSRVEDAARLVLDATDAHRYRTARRVDPLPPQLRAVLALDLDLNGSSHLSVSNGGGLGSALGYNGGGTSGAAAAMTNAVLPAWRRPGGSLVALAAVDATVAALQDQAALYLLGDAYLRLTANLARTSSTSGGTGGGMGVGAALPPPRLLSSGSSSGGGGGGVGGAPLVGGPGGSGAIVGAGWGRRPAATAVAAALPPPPPEERVHWGVLHRLEGLLCGACGRPVQQALRGHPNWQLVALPSRQVYHDACAPLEDEL
jgi:hypothetical protein